MKENIHDLSEERLGVFLTAINEPAFRTGQIFQGLYHHQYSDWLEFSNLPKSLIGLLSQKYAISTLEPIDEIISADQLTSKTLFRLGDDVFVETVLLRKGTRLTLCISTQAGCPVGCIFCATGKIGLIRNLTAGEIIEQILFFSRKLSNRGETLTNIVLMGMGEPLLNYDNTLFAIQKMINPLAMNVGARRITLSTIGIIPKIYELANEKIQINLAVSLHAPTQKLRNQLVPISRKFPLKQLIQACKEYFIQTGRRVTFEYVMIGGINDSPNQAMDLSKLLIGFPCHVNLIPLNPLSEFQGDPSTPHRLRDFGRILLDHNIPVSIRDSQGADIRAGCGQLAGRQLAQ